MRSHSIEGAFHGNADKTPGGLSKNDLIMKDGRVVSKAASKAALARMKKEGKKAMVKVVQEVGFQASAQEWYR